MTSVVRFSLLSWFALSASAWAHGCGPSIRMVHQSNAYFERCHAADYDPEVTVEIRRQCWAAWIEHYREGQSQDRVLYARHRMVELELGEGAEPLPGVTGTEVSYTASYLTAEEGDDAEPTTAVEAAEAAEATDGAAGLPGPIDVVGDPAVPHDDIHGVTNDRDHRRPALMRGACAGVCGPRWDTCMERCDSHSQSCQRACEAEQRICMHGCY